MTLTKISRWLCKKLRPLTFAAPVAYVYNPLEYAQKPHEAYLSRYGQGEKEIVFLGMNPGPWGMAQNGVPFGHIGLVRDFLGIDEPVKKPKAEHPKRQILGFDCPRSEVSGARFWGWAQENYGNADTFFSRFYVANYCPLCFLEDSGRNRIPEKLPAAEREPLFEYCDEALRRTIELLQAKFVVGIGAFAEKRAKIALAGIDVQIGRVLHPSPASPKANKGWAKFAEEELRQMGIEI